MRRGRKRAFLLKKTSLIRNRGYPESMGRWLRSQSFAWAAAGLLAALCGVVAYLQYSWIGEISVGERQRLQEALEDRLSRIQRTFFAQEQALVLPLVPNQDEIEKTGRERAYEERYRAWKEAHPAAFRAIALVIPQEGSQEVALKQLDWHDGRFKSARWPAEWESTREYSIADSLVPAARSSGAIPT